MSIFNHVRIREQIDDFVAFKNKTKNMCVACSHKERLIKFVYLTHAKDVYSIRPDDVYYFKQKLLDTYASDYVIYQSIHSVYCLLRFYRRFDVIRTVTTGMRVACSSGK